MGKLFEQMKKEIYKECKPQIDELKSMFAPCRQSEEEVISEIIKRQEHKYYLVFERSRTENQIIEKDIYTVFDEKNQERYQGKGKLPMGKHRIVISKEGTKLGFIKKRLIALPDILEWELKRKKSIVTLSDGEEYNILSYVTKKRRHFRMKRKHWKITAKDDGYVISYQKNTIAHVYKPFTSEIYKNKKWLLGYEVPEKEEDLAMLVIAIWNMVRD